MDIGQDSGSVLVLIQRVADERRQRGENKEGRGRGEEGGKIGLKEKIWGEEEAKG